MKDPHRCNEPACATYHRDGCETSETQQPLFSDITKDRK